MEVGIKQHILISCLKQTFQLTFNSHTHLFYRLLPTFSFMCWWSWKMSMETYETAVAVSLWIGFCFQQWRALKAW